MGKRWMRQRWARWALDAITPLVDTRQYPVLFGVLAIVASGFVIALWGFDELVHILLNRIAIAVLSTGLLATWLQKQLS